jgi:hypothetical protein
MTHLRERHRSGLKKYLESGKRQISWKAFEMPGLTRTGEDIFLELSFSEFFHG